MRGLGEARVGGDEGLGVAAGFKEEDKVRNDAQIASAAALSIALLDARLGHSRLYARCLER